MTNRDSRWQCCISSITLFFLFLIAYKGAGAFAKVNYFIFAALVVALVVSIGTLFVARDTIYIDSYTNNENVVVPINGTFKAFSFDRSCASDVLYPTLTRPHSGLT